MVFGAPCMCMRMTSHRDPAAKVMAPSSASALTSFQIVAPAANAALAVPILRVSMEIGRSVRRLSRAITGSVRAISSVSLTGSAPGRVDSPPMSSTSAPAATRRSACSTAASGSKALPPSEKLSGVTLTTPMISGRRRVGSAARSFSVTESRARIRPAPALRRRRGRARGG